MAYTTLTLEESIEIARDEIRNRIPGADVSRGSDYDIRARVLGTLFFGLQAQGDYLARQALPDTAELEYLERHAAIRGVYRQPAAGATGAVLLVGSDPGPLLQPSGSTLKHADGTRYVLTAPCTVQIATGSGKTVADGTTRSRIIVAPNTTGIVAGNVYNIGGELVAVREVLSLVSAFDVYRLMSTAPVPGEPIVQSSGGVAFVRSLSRGATTNKPVRDVLTLDSPVTLVSAAASVLLMSGGGDAETDDEVRARVIDHTAVPPGAGNVEDYRMWARTTPNVRVGDVFVFPNQRGLGTVDVFPIGVSGARLPSASMLAAVTAQIAAKAPAIVDVLVKSFTYSAQIDVTATLVAGPEYASDFGLTSFTTASGSTTTLINFTGSPVGVIEVGDRVVVQVQIGGLWYAFERPAAIVTASGVVLSSPLPAAPVAGQVVRSGGPLWQLAYAAVLDIFDTLGPGTVAGGIGYVRHPTPVDAFPETLYLSTVVAALKIITGTLNVTVTAPALDTTAALGEILRRGKIDILSA